MEVSLAKPDVCNHRMHMREGGRCMCERYLCRCGPSAPCFLSALPSVNRKQWLLFSAGLFSSVCPLVASLPLPPSLTVYKKPDSPPQQAAV